MGFYDLTHGSAEDDYVKRMANLLRQGSTLTELSCPVCASPLFRLKSGDLWCERCQKKVVVTGPTEAEEESNHPDMLADLEATLLGKIQTVRVQIENEGNPVKLKKLTTALSELLDALGKARSARKG